MLDMIAKNKYQLIFILFLLIGCTSIGVNTKKETIENEAVEDLAENAEKIDTVKISEFILGVGDTIEVSVYRQSDIQRTVRIDHSGIIMLPLIGDVQAAGKSIFKVRDEIKDRLSKYLVDPQVFVNVTTIQSQKIMVLGEVNNPGIFTLDSDIRVIEAISRAGGMTINAKLGNVLLIRKKQGKPGAVSLNLKKALKEGDTSQNWMLQNGDIIYLPSVTIANVSRYFSHISQILSPFVSLESGIVLWPQVKDVLQGKEIENVPLSIPTQ
jgi:polysaccharide export outer membrane protein